MAGTFTPEALSQPGNPYDRSSAVTSAHRRFARPLPRRRLRGARQTPPIGGHHRSRTRHILAADTGHHLGDGAGAREGVVNARAQGLTPVGSNSTRGGAGAAEQPRCRAAVPPTTSQNLQPLLRRDRRDCGHPPNLARIPRCFGAPIRHVACNPNRPCVVISDDGRVWE